MKLAEVRKACDRSIELEQQNDPFFSYDDINQRFQEEDRRIEENLNAKMEDMRMQFDNQIHTNFDNLNQNINTESQMSLERSDRLQDDLNRYLNEVRQRMDSEDQMIKEDIMHV